MIVNPAMSMWDGMIKHYMHVVCSGTARAGMGTVNGLTAGAAARGKGIENNFKVADLYFDDSERHRSLGL